MLAIQSQLPQDSNYYYFFVTEDNVLGPSLGEVEEIRVETKEVEKKVIEEMPKRVMEEMVEEKMMEEEVVLEMGQMTIVGVEKSVASVAQSCKGSSSGGRCRKKVVEEAEEVEDRVTSITVQVHAIQSQSP